MNIIIIFQYVLALLFFLLSIVIHEMMHYLAASFYNLTPKFSWIKAKEKKTIGIFGYLPGVTLQLPKNLKQYAIVSLSPIPITTIILTYFFILWNAETFNFSIFYFIVVISAGLMCSLMGSSADIRDYRFYKYFWNMRFKTTKRYLKYKTISV